MPTRYEPQDDIRFLRKQQETEALFVYKEHSRARFNANAFRLGLHIHPSAEMLMVRTGEIELLLPGGRTEVIRDGEAALLFPFQSHGYSRERGTEYFRFNFSTFIAKSFFKAIENRIGERAVFTPTPEDRDPFLKRLQRGEHPPVYKVKGFLYSMLSDYQSQVPMTERSVDDSILTRAIFYMDTHKRQQITVADVAAALGYNEKYLSRCINKAAELSFSALLSTLRMDDAKVMLLETDKTILDIAMDCGFGSERTFYRQFNELMGISPRAYRLKNNHPATVKDDILL